MDDLIFSVKNLAELKRMSIKELADSVGIPYNHLKEVQAGRVMMSAEDLKLLSEFTGVPGEQIEIKKHRRR